MNYKKLLITLIVFSIFMPSQAFAEEPSNYQKIKNLGQFFRTFIDLDNSLNSWIDEAMRTNTCKKRDITSLQSQKDTISDLMLEQYKTLSEEDMRRYKFDYALLDSEITFLRSSNKDRSQLIDKVQKKASKLVKGRILEEIDAWYEKYSEQLMIGGEYDTCPTPWKEVSENWKSLSENLNTIIVEAQAFKNQAKSTWKGFKSIPKGAYNSIRSGVEDSIANSISATQENIQENLIDVVNTAVYQASRQAVSTNNYMDALVSEYEAANTRQDVATAIETETNLAALTAILSQSDFQVEQNQERVIQDNSIEYLTRYQDSINLALWGKNLEINTALRTTNTLLNNEPDGLVELFGNVASKQCRL